MKLTKKGFIFVLLIVSALVVGSIVINFSSPTSWIGTSISLGISPVTVDLIALQLTFGLTLNVGVAHIVMLIVAIIVYPFITRSID